jgi:type I restriction enzyme, S subunit
MNQVTSLNMEQKFKKTPAGEIPVDWEISTLGKLGTFINGHGFKPRDWKISGTPIIRIQNLNGSSEFNYYQGEADKNWNVKTGDLLFSWSGSVGTSFGPFIWKGPEALLNQHIFNIRTSEIIDRTFLYYLLKNITSSIEGAAHGSAGLVHITKKRLESFFVPLPSIDEQLRIAEILSVVDIVIEKTAAIIEKTRQLKKELMERLLTNGVGNKGKISKGWCIRPLGEVATLQRGFDLPVQNRRKGVIPIYGSNGIHGYHDHTSLNGPGVITGRSGSIGFVYYSDGPYWPLNTTLYIKDFHGNNPKFIVFLLESLQLQRYVASTGVPSLNRNFVHPLPVLVPPLDEQARIVAILKPVDDVYSFEKSELQQLNGLKNALMQVLLAGRVRVKS